MLKQILERHTVQLPPHSIFIFTEKEVQDIINFMLRTFFRHYSLYEYSFKPKVDIILMTMPENVNQESAKGPGSSLAHNSLVEASKANDEIGEINLDGSVEKDPADDK